MSLPDYHVHTYLCGHAAGDPNEYIKTALDKGIAEIGFSDHAPLPVELRAGITMAPDDMEPYLTMIRNLREDYKTRIKVKSGLEVDYPFHNSFDRRYLRDPRLDYIIGSCHFIGDWAFDHPREIDEFNRRDIDGIYGDYFSILGKLIETDSCNILGHFDLVKKFGHRARSDFRNTVARLARRCAEKGIAVEINTSGLRKPVSEVYPSETIIAVLYSENVPLTLGSDSHSPEEVGYEFDRAVASIRNAGYRKISGFIKRKRYDILL